jgi:hypothetical protein
MSVMAHINPKYRSMPYFIKSEWIQLTNGSGSSATAP